MAKSPIDHLFQPVNKFIKQEFIGGIALFVSVIIALLWVNSPWSSSYHELWDKKIVFNFLGNGLDQPLHVWINDGLMALFFFVIGLELKRNLWPVNYSLSKKHRYQWSLLLEVCWFLRLSIF